MYLVSLLAIIFVFIGCSSKQLITHNNKSKTHGEMIGSIGLIIDGEGLKGNCELDIKGDNYSDTIEFNGAGSLNLTLPIGKFSATSLYCKASTFSIPVYHYFKEGDLDFYNYGDEKITYFGEVSIDWKTHGPNPILYILSIPLAYLTGGGTDEMRISWSDSLNQGVKREPASLQETSKLIVRSFPNVSKKYHGNSSNVIAFSDEKDSNKR